MILKVDNERPNQWMGMIFYISQLTANKNNLKPNTNQKILEKMKTNEKTTQWQLEGSSAEAYERYLVPGMFKPWAERLIEIVDFTEKDCLLDAACGTGILARCAAKKVKNGAKVKGLDINEGMLEMAKKTPSGSAIQWKQGDISELPFEDHSFDIVCCQQALQFVDNPSVALTEMYRVLKPKGRMGLAVWRSLKYNWPYRITSDALEQYAGPRAGAMMRSPFPAWNIKSLQNMIENAGFNNVHTTIGIGSMRYPSVEEFIRRESLSSPLAGPLKELDPEILSNLVDSIQNELQTYIDDDGLTFPMETFMIVASKE